MPIVIYSIILLGSLSLVGAIALYFVAKKFRVDEDPRIDAIAGLLPGANCGGCSLKGCRDFATTCVRQGNLNGLYCPVGGNTVMGKIADIIGIAATETKPKIAVLRCNGTCAARPARHVYDGANSCAIIASVASGTRGCSYGCLGCGDCANACKFDAIKIDPVAQLPVVDEEKCTACGACEKMCPRHLIELRDKGPKSRRVWVACSNRDRGATARKECAAACIGCGKCEKTCTFGAISVTDNVAYIAPDKCRLCRKCIAACPTGAIHTNFQPATAPDLHQPKPKD